jgi:hypothetical protein
MEKLWECYDRGISAINLLFKLAFTAIANKYTKRTRGRKERIRQKLQNG